MEKITENRRADRYCCCNNGSLSSENWWMSFVVSESISELIHVVHTFSWCVPRKWILKGMAAVSIPTLTPCCLRSVFHSNGVGCCFFRMLMLLHILSITMSVIESQIWYRQNPELIITSINKKHSTTYRPVDKYSTERSHGHQRSLWL